MSALLMLTSENRVLYNLLIDFGRGIGLSLSIVRRGESTSFEPVKAQSRWSQVIRQNGLRSPLKLPPCSPCLSYGETF